MAQLQTIKLKRTQLKLENDVVQNHKLEFGEPLVITGDETTTYLALGTSQEPEAVSAAPVFASFTIKKPRLSTNEFCYDSRTHSPALVDFDERFMTASGALTGKGSSSSDTSYNITIKLKSNLFTWEDGTSADIILTWVVYQKNLSIVENTVTQTAGDNSTKIASTAFVATADNAVATKAASDLQSVTNALQSSITAVDARITNVRQEIISTISNRVYVQSAAPVGTSDVPLRKGDLWICTNASNSKYKVIQYYTGSAWDDTYSVWR